MIYVVKQRSGKTSIIEAEHSQMAADFAVAMGVRNGTVTMSDTSQVGQTMEDGSVVVKDETVNGHRTLTAVSPLETRGSRITVKGTPR